MTLISNLIVLIVPQSDENDVSLKFSKNICSKITKMKQIFIIKYFSKNSTISYLIDPDLLPQFAANVADALLAVEAMHRHTAVTQHSDHLAVLFNFFKVKTFYCSLRTFYF